MEPVGCMKQNFEFVRRSDNIPLSSGMTGVINAAPGRCRIRKPTRQNPQGKTCNQEQRLLCSLRQSLEYRSKSFAQFLQSNKSNVQLTDLLQKHISALFKNYGSTLQNQEVCELPSFCREEDIWWQMSGTVLVVLPQAEMQ